MALNNSSTDEDVKRVVETVIKEVRALAFFVEDRARSLALHGLQQQMRNALDEFIVDRTPPSTR